MIVISVACNHQWILPSVVKMLTPRKEYAEKDFKKQSNWGFMEGSEIREHTWTLFCLKSTSECAVFTNNGWAAERECGNAAVLSTVSAVRFKRGAQSQFVSKGTWNVITDTRLNGLDYPVKSCHFARCEAFFSVMICNSFHQWQCDRQGWITRGGNCWSLWREFQGRRTRAWQRTGLAGLLTPPEHKKTQH